MKLDEAPPDHELKGKWLDGRESMQVHVSDLWNSSADWLLYWRPDSDPNDQHDPENTTKGSNHRSSDFIDLTTTTPSPPQTDTFTAQSVLESHSPSPTQKRSFAYWPHVLFAFFVFQIVAFAVQFSYFRETGLPILKNWPIVYAMAAPANTCIYATSMLKLAPFRWPGLAKESYARWGMWAINGIWVLWSLGIWLEVRRWCENGTGSGGAGA